MSVPDVLMLCAQCLRHRLRLLQGLWYCFGCGSKEKEPTLVYDLRRT
jgi:ribosomal protein L37AE/L43A